MNIIWVFGVQHRGQALGCTGNDFLRTPNIVSLAPAGKLGVAGAPLCTPYRSALLTGQYPHKGAYAHDIPLPDGKKMVSDVFNEQGYHTAYFGKWHVDGAANRAAGQRSGMQMVRKDRRGRFGTWLGYENNNVQYDCWLHGHAADGENIPHFKLGGYETDALTSLLIDYLADCAREKKQGDGKPFFAVLSVQPPHSPYVADECWTERFKPEDIPLRANVPPVERIVTASCRSLAGYYAMIENLDWNVGRILEALQRNGLQEETIIVFFSDHGDMHGSHGHTLKCRPYEESIRVPFLIGGAVTETATARMACPDIVNHVDIAPTSLGLCNIDPPEWMEGTDYSGYFMANRARPKKEPNSAYLQLVDPGFELGFAIDRERPWRGIVTRDGWKYAVLEGQPWLMFDLNEDPYELANLAMDRSFNKKRHELQAELVGWLEKTDDHFQLPVID